MADQSSARFTDPQTTFTFRTAFIIVGCTCLLLICLIVLRFLCYMAIDVCILCDIAEARRTASQWKDWLFPCFRRRLVRPEGGGRGEEASSAASSPEDPPATTSTASTPAIELVNLSRRMLSTMTLEEKRNLLESVLPRKIVHEDDRRLWKHLNDAGGSPSASSSNHVEDSFGSHLSHSEQHQHRHHHHDDDQNDAAFHNRQTQDDTSSVSSIALLCSICLHDIEVGNEATMTNSCDHIFHRGCRMDYIMSSNDTTCPYCRTDMVPSIMDLRLDT